MIHWFASNTNVIQWQVYERLLAAPVLAVPAAQKQNPQKCELLQVGSALLMLQNSLALTNTP